MQSCKVYVYDKHPVPVDEAINYTNRVKAKTFVDETYEFNDLIRENGQLYGITKRGSKTAKKLNPQIVDNNFVDKFAKIMVLENTIKSYYLENKKKSNLKSGIIILVTLAALIGFTALIIEAGNKQFGGVFPGHY
jgi:hypothetical protein